MATTKQKRLAREIVGNMEREKPLPAGALVEKSGYAEIMKKNPKNVIERKGVQEELQVLGFTEAAAKGVVVEVMHESDNDMARLKASDQVFKVLGSYAPEKRETKSLIMHANITQEEEQVAQKATEELKKLYAQKKT